MTKRYIVFRQGDKFFVSQDFDGDKDEADEISSKTGSDVAHELLPTCNWKAVLSTVDGREHTDPDCWDKLIFEVEKMFDYAHQPLKELSEEQFRDFLKWTEEVWMLNESGVLTLQWRCGKTIAQAIKDVAEGHFGFKVRPSPYSDDNATIMAKNTDGKWVSWFTVCPNYRGREPLFRGLNTVTTNIWLSETRPDMTEERCRAFFDAIEHELGVPKEEKDPDLLPTFIDPKDWQAIISNKEEKKSRGEQQLRTETPLGTLVAYLSHDPDNPGIHIDLERINEDGDLDSAPVALVEVTKDEGDVDGVHLISRLWNNVSVEDHQTRCIHTNIEEFFSQD